MLLPAAIGSTDEHPAPGGANGLSFLQPIPRHLVHRAAVAEVFLTDAVAVAEDRFLLAAQWPRDHAMYCPDAAGTSDPLLFAETIRQALVYLAHRHYAVPLSHRFIGCDMDFEITDPRRLRVGAAPVPVVLEADWSWEANKPPHRYGMRLEVTLTVEGEQCGRGSLRVIAVDDKRYTLLRGRAGRNRGAGATTNAARVAGHGRMPAVAVGRLRAKDSVLVRGREQGEWWLELDLDHAILFDHPSDHAPLMATLEGFRQLGHLLAREAGTDAGTDAEAGPPTLVSLATDCLAFGELDDPIRLVVRDDRTAPGPGGSPVRRFMIDAIQNGIVLASSRTGWLPAHHSV